MSSTKQADATSKGQVQAQNRSVQHPKRFTLDLAETPTQIKFIVSTSKLYGTPRTADRKESVGPVRKTEKILARSSHPKALEGLIKIYKKSDSHPVRRKNPTKTEKTMNGIAGEVFMPLKLQVD